MRSGWCSCEDEEAVATGCARGVEGAIARLRRRFRRPEAAEHAADYLRGLLAPLERKNGWQLAEQAGYAHPRGMQRVLDRYAWDAERVRDDLRALVVAEFGDPGGVLVVDETGFPKQGRQSVAVARQYCGTLGKLANCQIGVFLGYASARGRVGLDRALYLPKEWAEDRARRRRVGIPDGVPFRTKPHLAGELVERALDAGVPAAWVTADEVYGGDGGFRAPLEARGQAHVLAVRSNQAVSTWPPQGAPAASTAARLVATVPVDGWQRLSCGEGAQGPRVYDWALVPARPALRAGWVHAVLARRHPERLQEIAWYLVYAPQDTPLAEIVRAAGARWAIEETFKLAKGQVGLDQYEVRSWQGWYRHVTLALLALAALAGGADRATGPKGGRGTAAARCTSRSPSPRSVACWSDCCGPRPIHPQPSARSWPGRAGAVATRRSPRPATGAAA